MNEKIQRANEFYKQAQQNLALDKFKTAFELFSAAIEVNPEMIDAYYSRAVSRFKRARKKAIRLSRFDVEYHEQIALAVSDLDFVLEKNPKHAEAYFYRAYLCQIRYNFCDVSRVLADCNNAIRLNPNIAWAYYLRGVIFYKDRKYREAAEDFTQAMVKECDDWRIIEAASALWQTLWRMDSIKHLGYDKKFITI